jgi:protein translocase SEC61 complex gamma subunit
MKILKELIRVWKVTKKPTRKEYFTTVRIVLIGFLIIGIFGGIFQILFDLLLRRFFQ